MRYTLLLAAVLVATSAAAETKAPPRLPESFSYTIYIYGKRAGGTEAHVTYTGDAIKIDSRSWAELGRGTIEARCQTEADPRTYRVRSVRVQGVHPEAIVDARAEVSGDTVFTTMLMADGENTRTQVSRTGPPILIENYDMSHQVLLARALALSTSPTESFGLGFVSAGDLLEAKAGFVSEAAVESATSEAICRRLVVEVSAGSPFMCYYDPERGMPLYIAFPSVMTEAFLDDFYGDEPISRFRSEQ